MLLGFFFVRVHGFSLCLGWFIRKENKDAELFGQLCFSGRKQKEKKKEERRFLYGAWAGALDMAGKSEAPGKNEASLPSHFSGSTRSAKGQKLTGQIPDTGYPCSPGICHGRFSGERPP